jgi:hypothetical protein
MLKLWTLRIAATLASLALFAGTMIGSEILLRRSWRDLEDADTRMHIFRFHVYDPDFIWSAVAFGANAVIVLAMFLFCFWMFWIVIHRWDSFAAPRSRR